MNLDYVVNRRFAPVIQSYDARDSVLYALSLGIGDDPLDEDELPYVYEGRAPRAVRVSVSRWVGRRSGTTNRARRFPGVGFCTASRASCCTVPCRCRERSGRNTGFSRSRTKGSGVAP